MRWRPAVPIRASAQRRHGDRAGPVRLAPCRTIGITRPGTRGRQRSRDSLCPRAEVSSVAIAVPETTPASWLQQSRSASPECQIAQTQQRRRRQARSLLLWASSSQGACWERAPGTASKQLGRVGSVAALHQKQQRHGARTGGSFWAGRAVIVDAFRTVLRGSPAASLAGRWQALHSPDCRLVEEGGVSRLVFVRVPLVPTSERLGRLSGALAVCRIAMKQHC